MRRAVVDGGEKVGIVGCAGLDQEDLGLRRHGVRPFDVQCGLQLPAARRVTTWVASSPGLVNPTQEGTCRGVGRRAKGAEVLSVKGVQVALNRAVVVGIDDGDRLTGAVPRDGGAIAEGDLVEPV